ncbi:invasion associated locus B family protein [Bradyrhizobium sp. BWA-3-5]|uniref:invasion associated locus B family protein n=1 Tax=Bradyrhizobium sp. BWA-3-5 TaxID=3080013 RepID=UPI00293ED56E|nr:invasion associated locus B family protein [Bradyrhizobium sp. BWA-3-5]WOH68025.1 invasion associated locus B family protein [Bradyrhizobium sp. BWA-3-5]
MAEQRIKGFCVMRELLAKIIFIVSTAVLCHTAPLRAQDNRPAEPNAVFIPQAHPNQAKKAAPARKVAPRPANQGQVQMSNAPGARVGALPNGASQLSETYGDWTLNCSTGTRACTLSQALVNKEGQRAFLIELRVAKDGASEGTILMPFGLKLEAGVLLKLDDQDLGEGLRFSTCVAQGCMLPINFPVAGMNAIRNGKALAVGALNMSDGQLVTFTISLNGFAVAVDRAVQLAKG